MSWYKKIKISATKQELESIGVEIVNGDAILYRGTDIKDLTINNLRYGDFLSSVPSGTDLTGNAGADSYGKYIEKYIVPIDHIEISNGELQYKGPSKSLSGGSKYPEEIYRAYNDYYGSNYTSQQIDQEDYKIVKMVASMALGGGRDEFDILLRNHKNELV